MSVDSSTAGPATGSRGTILVVDDEPGIRKFACRLLESAGHQAIAAGDGAQALDIFSQRHGDIAAVVMDLSMPGMDGRDLVRELRLLAADIPILVMSGYSDKEVAEKLGGLGAIDLVHKPFRPRDLIDRLQQALARKTPAGNIS